MSRKSVVGMLVVAAALLLVGGPAQAVLLEYWPLDETTGATAPTALPGVGHNGTLVNFSFSGTSNWVVDGTRGNVLSFDGNTDPRDYVNTGYPNRTMNSFTVSWWLNPLDARNYNQQMTSNQNWNQFVFHASTDGGGSAALGTAYVGVGGGNNQRFNPVQATPPPDSKVLGPGTVTAGVWQHYAFTYDNGTAALYKDGAQIAYTTTMLKPPEMWQGIRFGTGDGNTINGMLDDVAVWSTALPAAEVQKLAARTATPLTVVESAAAGAADVAYTIQGVENLYGAYLSTDYNLAGTLFTSGSGIKTGTIKSVPVGQTAYIHIHAELNNTPPPGYPYGFVVAKFDAPGGTTFQLPDGSKSTTFLTTGYSDPKDPNAAWTGASQQWLLWQTHPPDPPQAAAMTVDSEPRPEFGGATRIWYAGANPPDTGEAYLSGEFMLVPAPWNIKGTPLASISQPEGLTARLVHTTNAMSSLALADAALAMKPGDPGHYNSELRTLDKADIGNAGLYSPTVGVLLPNEVGNLPTDNYAASLAGYVYAPTDGYTRTFAANHDDGFRLKIGGIEVINLDATGWPTTANVKFETAGYWPIEATWRQGGGNHTLEIVSAENRKDGSGNYYDWTADDVYLNPGLFAVLGTDPLYPVYQRPDGVPNYYDPDPKVRGTGANSVGKPTIAGAPGAPGDGLRVQSAPTGVTMGNINQALAFYGDPKNQNAGNVVPDGDPRKSKIDYIEGGGGGGNFGLNLAMPYTGDNYATRVSGLIYIPSAGDYAFAIGTDDGFMVKIGNQTLGRLAPGRGIPGGAANQMFAHFDEPGLYPIRVYQYDGGGGSALEFSMNPTANAVSMLNTTTNPASLGFTPDFGTSVYSIQPVARLSSELLKLKGAAYVNVPALGVQVAPEKWTLQKRVSGAGARIPGLLGQYYDYSANQGAAWDETRPLIGTRNDLQAAGATFNFPDNYAYGPWGNTEDQFGARWTGYLNIPFFTDAISFRMGSDDNSWIFIDLNNDGTLEAAPGNGQWWVEWDDIALSPGLHKVEFRAREYGGGEWSQLYYAIGQGARDWQILPADFLSQNMFDGAWLTLAQGTQQVGDLTNNDYLKDQYGNDIQFPYDESAYLRLVTELAGQFAVADGDFRFVPEPATLALLGAGLLALARRRRTRRAN